MTALHNYSAQIKQSDFSSGAIKFCSHTPVCQEILLWNGGKYASKMCTKPIGVNCDVLSFIL